MCVRTSLIPGPKGHHTPSSVVSASATFYLELIARSGALGPHVIVIKKISHRPSSFVSRYINNIVTPILAQKRKSWQYKYIFSLFLTNLKIQYLDCHRSYLYSIVYLLLRLGFHELQHGVRKTIKLWFTLLSNAMIIICVVLENNDD